MSGLAIVFIATAVAAVCTGTSTYGPATGELITKPLRRSVHACGVGGGPCRHDRRSLALVLCLIGDVALLPAVDQFVVGLASFLLGHIAFVVMFALRGFDLWAMAGVAVVGCAGLLGTIAAPIVRGATARGLGVPVRGYLVVITSMCVLGWATGNWLIMVGSAAFIISDSILGWGQFVTEKKWIHLAIMVTYHVAIVSLALSLAI
jgi:uncharacterized membrane protein YhhN